MGCMGSTPSASTRRPSRRVNHPHSRPTSHPKPAQQNPGQISLQDLLKDYDIRKSLKILEEPIAEPSSDEIIKMQEPTTEELAKARRKQDKIKAEKEERWVVFSNLDAIAEADMLRVAEFMQTTLEQVPKVSLA